MIGACVSTSSRHHPDLVLLDQQANESKSVWLAEGNPASISLNRCHQHSHMRSFGPHSSARTGLVAVAQIVLIQMARVMSDWAIAGRAN